MMTRYELRSSEDVWISEYEQRAEAERWARVALGCRPQVHGVGLPPLACVRVVEVRGGSRRTIATVRWPEDVAWTTPCEALAPRRVASREAREKADLT